jgi:hypothetical protein
VIAGLAIAAIRSAVRWRADDSDLPRRSDVGCDRPAEEGREDPSAFLLERPRADPLLELLPSIRGVQWVRGTSNRHRSERRTVHSRGGSRLLWQGSTEGLTVGVVANKRLAAQRRKFSRHIERSIREAERRSPQVAEIRARIRRAVRVGRAAVQSREQAQSRLADALRRLIGEGLSIREAAERVGVTFYDARSLVSGYDASDVLDAEWIAGIVCRPVRSQTWRHD